MRIEIDDTVIDRIAEFYTLASCRHSLDPVAEANKIYDDILAIEPSLPAMKVPTVRKWVEEELMQVTSSRTNWCYGIEILTDETGERFIHVARTEHQQNMTDKSITMQ